jgi:predicted nucleic acid-binding protein
MLYFDSSYLFRIYSQEAGHEAVKGLLPASGGIASAVHARVEFASIVLRHRREQSAPDELLIELHEQFLDECRAGHIRLLPQTDAILTEIERVLRACPRSTFIRAADALHLACAGAHGFTDVYSNDRHLLGAASLFGLRGLDVIPKPGA